MLKMCQGDEGEAGQGVHVQAGQFGDYYVGKGMIVSPDQQRMVRPDRETTVRPEKEYIGRPDMKMMVSIKKFDIISP